MKLHHHLTTLLSLALLALPAHAAPGDLDATFGTGGKVVTAVGSNFDYGRSVAVQSDGKVVVAGYSWNGSGSGFAVVRYTINGALDSGFGTGGKVTTNFGGSNDYGNSAAVQSDGKIVVAGRSWNGSKNEFAAVRFTSSGTLDSSFGSGGRVTTAIGSYGSSGESVAVQADGKIVVVGSSFNGTNNDFAVVRYTSSGVLDSTFGSGGQVTTAIGSSSDIPHSVAIQSDGKIVVAGDSYNGSYSDFALVRYTTSGAVDSTFGTSGKVTTAIGSYDDYCSGVALQNDGKIIVVGAVSDGSGKFALVRYTGSGALDSSFGAGGKVTTAFGSYSDDGRSVVVQSDGKVVAAGYSIIGGNRDFALVRYTSSGALDSSFGTNGKITTAIGSSDDFCFSMTLQSDGKIVAAGHSVIGGIEDFAIVRLEGDPAPPTVTTTAPTGITTTSGTLNGTINPNGLTTTAQFQYGLTTSYGSTASVTLSPNNGSTAQNVSTNLSGLTPSTLYHYRLIATNAGGTASTVDGTFTTSSLDPTFSGDGVQTTAYTYGAQGRAMAVQADGKVVVAGWVGNASNDDSTIVRYNVDGTLDGSFGTGGIVTIALGADDGFYAVAIQPDGKIVAAGTAHTGTSNEFALVRYNTNGSLDTTFDADGKVFTAFDLGGSLFDEILDIALQPDGKIVAVGLAYKSTATDIAIARYNANGSLDTSFDGDGKLNSALGTPNSQARAVALQPDGKIVVGGLIDNGTNYDIGLVRYLTNGALDGTFGTGGKVTFGIGPGNDAIYSIALQPDGKIVAAGDYVTGAGDFNGLLLRFHADGSNDSSFDGDGRRGYEIGASDDSFRGVSLQADGRIVAAGYARAGSYDDMAVLRVNVDGSLDTTFDGDGMWTLAPGPLFDRLYGVALAPDGAIVGAGTSEDASGKSQIAAVRLLNFPKPGVWNLAAAQGTSGANLGINGQIDPAGLSTTVSIEYGTTAGLGSTQSVGTFSGSGLQAFNATLYPGGLALGTTYYYRVVATNANGTTTSAIQTLVFAPGAPDFTFSGDGAQITPVFVSGNPVSAVGRGILRQADGKILVCGHGGVTNNTEVVLARYLDDGTLDTSFGTSGIIVTPVRAGDDTGTDMLQLPDGKIVISGTSSSAPTGGTRDVIVVRYLSDGTLDATFGVGGIARGSFSTLDDYGEELALQPDGKLLVCGSSINTSTGNLDTLVLRLNTDGFVDTTFNGTGYRVIQLSSTLNDVAADILLLPDGKIILAGYIGSSSPAIDSYIMRLNSNGSTDTTFGISGIRQVDAGGNDGIHSVALQADGRLVACGHATPGATGQDSMLLCFTSGGALDTSFNGTGKFILNHGNSDDYLNSIAIQPDGGLVAVGQSYNGSNFDWLAVRANPNGTPDTTFDGDGYWVQAGGSGHDTLNGVMIAPDGRILATGRSDTAGGVSQIAVVRLLGAQPITLSTLAATSVEIAAATLNGSVNPNGVATNAWFEYGLTTSYGVTTSTQAIGNGTSTVPVSANLISLTPGATYHYRLAAQNGVTTAYGADMTFTTLSMADIQVEQPVGTILVDGSATVDFGTTPLGTPVTRSFRVTNTGSLPLNVSALTLPAGYEHIGIFAPYALAPNATQNFDVRFLANTVPGTFNGTLTLTSDDPDAEGSFAVAITANVPQVTSAFAGGGIITETGGYRVHTFTGSGTLNVFTGGNVEVLVVAGGGSGGGVNGGGGGGGGVVYNTWVPISAGPISVTVGAGGVGGIGPGVSGGNSSFGALVALGGGGGGNVNAHGESGGSGGGGGSTSTTSVVFSGGSGIPGQGSAGGNSSGSSFTGAGGGGGAGGAGISGTATKGGDGGAGSAVGISGSIVSYGGGGGGGCVYGSFPNGGLGGSGGGGSAGNPGVAGVANTGGGGGGGGINGASGPPGGSGGSGIVIVRYALVAPEITNYAPSSITSTSATISGTVNPKGITTSAWIEWGLTTSFGNTTTSQASGYGTTAVPVSATLTGLTPGTTYYARLVAQNGVTTEYGSYSTFTTLTPYQVWAVANGVTGTNTGPNDDFDSDGIINQLEWAFGTDPAVNGTGVIIVAAGVITQHGIPTVRVQNFPNSVDYRALFGRRKDYLAAGLSYTVQFSADMTIWQSSAATPTVIADDGVIEACTVPYPFFINGKKARFFQVSVTTTP